MREALRFTGKVLSATVSREADRWFVAITVDTADAPKRPAEHEGAVGVDLGVLTLATLSTGERIPGPRALREDLKRLRRLSRGLCRKKKGSKNRAKAKIKLVRLHARIALIRQDSLHQLTADLNRRFDAILIDEVGYTPLSPDGARLVLQFFADMYERHDRRPHLSASRRMSVK